MLCTKWRMAVTSRHRFLQICWNLFSLSIPVRPVCSASTKKSTADTLATDLSSSASAASTAWNTAPSQWERVETTLVMPSTVTIVSEPVTSTPFTAASAVAGLSAVSGSGVWWRRNMADIRDSQKQRSTLGTRSRTHSFSMKVLRPKLLMKSRLVAYMWRSAAATCGSCWPKLTPSMSAAGRLARSAASSSSEAGSGTRARRQGSTATSGRYSATQVTRPPPRTTASRCRPPARLVCST